MILGVTPARPPRGASPDGFDLLAIGSGSAAFAAAIRASNLGARVGLIEAATVGGTCVNVGCIPSKALLAAAEAYHRAGRRPFPGVSTAQVGLDMEALVAGKDGIVGGLRQEKYLDLAEEYGFEIIEGRARFAGPDRLTVGRRELSARSFLIATGSAPSVPSIPGLAQAGYLTSTTALALDRLPDSMVVIGGSYIGLEMGQLFADLGSTVTIVEAEDRLAPNEEPEVSAWIAAVLRDQGIEVLTSARVVRAEGGRPKGIWVESGNRRHRLAATEILIAAGRHPVVSDLGLDAAGVECHDDGRLVLDEELRTTNAAVFAAGDVTGGPQFVYVAAAQGTLAADNALDGAARRMDYRALPRVTFTSPALAAVGLTDQAARAAGYECECRVLSLEHVPRARVNRDTRGGLKLVTERASGRLLGMSAVADGAGELILAGVYGVKFGLTVSDLADNWAPYLTMSEAVRLTAQSFTADVAKLSCCAV